jgi:CheY-like chemotaxis protein/glycine cleavage system H lipoate-binding protein
MEKKLNILAVDDEQIVLDSLSKLLRKENCSLLTALSVKEALILMEQNEIDIILTDLMLPEIDGLEFMGIVKKKLPYVPIIMITGYATINTALQATHLGAFDYIAKPFTKSELKSVIKRASDLVRNSKNIKEQKEENGQLKKEPNENSGSKQKRITTLGQNSWMMLEDNGIVVFGIEHSYLQTIGKIQSIYFPTPGDELRQGSVYLQITSSDLRSFNLLSPLSGSVVEINTIVRDDPNKALEDSYGSGWLIRLKPSRFEFEIKTMGL